MQLAWSRIWTRVTVSISNDDNHYTTGTSNSLTFDYSILQNNIYTIAHHSVVFTNGPVDQDSIPGRVIRKTQKRVFDTSLINTQHYTVPIKGKMEHSSERSSALPYTV